MTAITNFEDFLFAINEPSLEEISHIYEAVQTGSSVGIATVTWQGEALIVDAGASDEPLLLASAKAREAFLKLLDKRYGSDVGVMLEAAFRRSLAKDD